MAFTRKCDISKPFALVSYSHKDKEKVQKFTSELIDKGYNIWIDENEIPDGDKWDLHALERISEQVCKAVLFFRSAASVVSENVEKELIEATLTNAIHETRILVIDIEVEASDIADFYLGIRKELYDKRDQAIPGKKQGISNRIATFRYFESKFDHRLISFYYENKARVEKIWGLLAEMGIANQEAIDNKTSVQLIANDANEANQDNESDDTSTPQDSLTKKREATYKIKEVRAFDNTFLVKNQNEAMSKLYELLLSKYPEKLNCVLNKQQHVSLGLEKKAQFNSFAQIHISGQEIYVGTSFSMKDKLKELTKLCEIVGIPTNSIGFIDVNDMEYVAEDGSIVSFPHQRTAEAVSAQPFDSIESIETLNAEGTSKNKEVGNKINWVRAFQDTYPVKNQNEAMIKLYELLLATYPERLQQVIHNQQHVSFLKEGKAQFNSFAKIVVAGQEVFVGTSLSMKDKLKGLAKLCRILGIPDDSIGFIDVNQVEHRA